VVHLLLHELKSEERLDTECWVLGVRWFVFLAWAGAGAGAGGLGWAGNLHGALLPSAPVI
jgi:hypothetical protein